MLKPLSQFGLYALGILAISARMTAAEPSSAGIEFFEKNIRPVLAEKCYQCHSAAAEKIKSNLLLDTREGLLKGGDGGPSVIPGDVEKSPLAIAIRYADKEMQMPPKHQLPAEQIKLFEQWIKMGAPGPRVGPAVKAPELFDYVKAKTFWSFQPVKDSAPPTIGESSHPIDRFIAARRAAMKISAGPLADRRTLIRRLTFDLIGLPPTPEEVDAFTMDSSADAWTKVIDRLLASPAYGEKWGRHWLDLVRYADTSGCNSDYPIPAAYKYRNYVIDSFNRDKPYDQFLKEQIAGDLLPHQNEAEKFEHVIATGYLAIARRFGSRQAEFHLTLDDAIDNMGKSMLGLSLGCARCHDHKFDPIPASDYYGIYGILSSTKFAFPGTEIYQHPKNFTVLAGGEIAEAYGKREVEMSALDDRYERLLQARKPLEIADRENKKSGTPVKPPVMTKANADLPHTLAEVKAEMVAIKEKLKQKETHPLPVEKAYAVFEGTPANAHILRKGDPKSLGDEAPRGFLQVLGGQKVPVTEKGSGRLELAEWIASAGNPLTSRVMVNRIWQGHFGNGIVQTPNDFGARGKVPTHPELLDWLASRFVQNGWSIKAMHRLILTSQTYQLASDDDNETHSAGNSAIDANNDGLWHFNRRRLEAEEVRDSLLAMGGALESGEGGPHPFPTESEWKFSQHRPFVATYETNRRSVYLMQQRIKRHPFLEVFDGADTNSVTAGRARETSPLQALFYLNDPLAHDAANRFAARLAAYGPEDRQIDAAFRLCFARTTTSDERLLAHEYLRDTIDRMKRAEVPEDRQAQSALASYVRVLLGSNEFFYVD